MKILNAYAGIGGNRKNWDGDKHDITAVEINEEIAEEYERLYPEDEVVVGDAHKYIKENHEKFDFIWSSPPCQTHSTLSKISVMSDTYQCKNREPEYPDMKLYQEIILLKHFFQGDWVVENVDPYYREDIDFKRSDCLIKPQKTSRHLFWSNFSIPEIDVRPDFEFSSGGAKKKEMLEEWLGIKLSKNIYKGSSHDPAQVLRNAVHPRIGQAILKARKSKQVTVDAY